MPKNAVPLEKKNERIKFFLDKKNERIKYLETLLQRIDKLVQTLLTKEVITTRSFELMCKREGVIEPEEYKHRWKQYLAGRDTLLWQGVGYGFPSLIQMFFAGIELGLHLYDTIYTITVKKCNKLKWATILIDGDGVLIYNVDRCNCEHSCDSFDRINGAFACAEFLRQDEVTREGEKDA